MSNLQLFEILVPSVSYERYYAYGKDEKDARGNVRALIETSRPELNELVQFIGSKTIGMDTDSWQSWDTTPIPEENVNEVVSYYFSGDGYEDDDDEDEGETLWDTGDPYEWDTKRGQTITVIGDEYG